MNPYANEDVAWQRLKDLQVEADNRRLAASQEPWSAALRRLATRAWYLARLASQRPPRRSPRSASKWGSRAGS
ncbi:MAG: hypothetical protein E6J05_02400 [Chloroflexi bacterium]|nr:MAG: hypothetical protein E6J05_02400 [Chloroflexota bacterium]